VQQALRLEVGGRPAPPEMLEAIQRLDVEDHTELAGLARLRLGVAVAPGGDRWPFVDDGPFTRLASLKVQARVGSRLQTILDGHVVEAHAILDPKPEGSALEVVAMDATALMNLEEKVRAWPDRSDADVAQEIFAEHGLDADVEPTQPTHQEREALLVQRGTDIRFLRRLARRHGYECYVEADPAGGRPKGHFHPPRLDEPPQGTLTVGMGAAGNVDQFAVRHHMVHATQAQAHAVDAASLEPQSGSAEGMAARPLGREPLGDGPRPRRVLLAGGGTAAELDAASQAVRDRTAWELVAEGRLNTASFGKVLRAKRNVLVRGVGRRFGGTWRVERVLHSFAEDGHAQHFTLRRNAVGLEGGEAFGAGGAR
jgi:phage protein D